MSGIAVQKVSKHFGSVRAVEDLTFDVPAGKTTTLRMLLGLVAPTEGQLLIGGRRHQDGSGAPRNAPPATHFRPSVTFHTRQGLGRRPSNP